jgi:branched-chain amino acid transport system ATP-binding protein
VKSGRAPVLEARQLTVTYGGVRALSGVSLEARAGQVVGIIGPNGAGKTTLFDAVSGLRRPNEGAVHLEGRDVTGRPAVWLARRGLHRTFQRQQVFSRLSVEDNLLSAAEWEGGGGGMAADLIRLPSRHHLEERRRSEVAAVLDECGLTSLRSVKAGVLPIAAARLLEIGRALIGKPRLLLLDEPTSGMGTKEIAILEGIIQSLRSEGECAVLLVEHDMSFVMSQCQFIYVLAVGSVLASGSPAAVRANESVRRAYLGGLEEQE